MTLRRLTFAVLFAVVPLAANAINVPTLPEGMCALDSGVPEQDSILKTLSADPSNELVKGFASCSELDAIKEGKAKSVSHYGAVLQQKGAQNLGMDRATYLEIVSKSMASGGGKLTQSALSSVVPLLGASTKDTALENPSSIGAASKGVIYSDPRMVIIGIEQANALSGGTTKVASTAGITMVGTQPMSVNLYTPLSDKDAFETSAQAIKPVINSMIRAN